jgi:uncharacterized protein (UPF0335 family)
LDKTVIVLEVGIRNKGDSISKDKRHGVLDCLHYFALEENFEHGCKVRPNVAPDLDVNVVAIYINQDIKRLNRWNSAPVRGILGGKRDSQTEIYGVHLHISVTSGHKNTQAFVSEITRVENTRKILAQQVNAVLGRLPSHRDVVGILRNCEVVAVRVVL